MPTLNLNNRFTDIMRRRRAIAVIITTLVSVGGYYQWRRVQRDNHLPDARMRQDYTDGEIYETDSWFLSAYEVETLQINDASPVINP